MAKRKLGGLGKGLDSLFADLPETDDAAAGVTTLPLREIEPDPDQPRKRFDEAALAELAASIQENGLLQPIAVRPKPLGAGYLIIAGERRWRAARLAGLDEVPALIKDVTDEQAAALALIENLQREDLDPIEVAEGCRQLIEKYGLTQETAAKRLGKSRSAVTNSLRLLNLPDDVRAKVSDGSLSAGHAKALLGLPDAARIRQAAGEIEARGLNVRQAEALCKKLAKPPKAPKPKPDAFTRPKRAVEIEAALKEVTGSEVRVEYKDGKGSLKIDFYSDQMLDQFAALLGRYDPEK
ncbi:MAG TPA: ParB/RepB/Spo0J family partition protein [Candidatus Gemmiger excrementipullorum]|uniref:ParB/RepB/Spo0J family partition protein n=1 Tax=Candidatus Gemmiger excrementipullorum TaxID=2838610 RepID=A0A9D1XZ50_9FIRM|nr:ParB/RepB/Spo0J family partition protein [Candidatus Gemmiger excrementipullorum]